MEDTSEYGVGYRYILNNYRDKLDNYKSELDKYGDKLITKINEKYGIKFSEKNTV